MKIQRIEIESVSMQLAEPFTIAYQTIESTTNIFLRIHTDQGLSGVGCASPQEAITGEKCSRALQSMSDIVEPVLRGADPLRFTSMLYELKQSLGFEPSVMAAVDMALYDLMGKYCGVPVWKLLGGFRDRIRTSVTIGILPEKETLTRAKEWVARGFSRLKLKGGRDVEADVSRVSKVRETVGEEIDLCFDANQGYSVDETLYFIEQTQVANLEFIEQPTPKNKPELLGQVREKGASVPIMADESLMSCEDAFFLAKKDLVDLFNIKLMKVGGIRQSLRINAVARAAHLKVMVGCMDEAALGIAAGLHFALACPNVVYADLDGHLDLKGDPTSGLVTIHDGILFPAQGAGFGL